MAASVKLVPATRRAFDRMAADSRRILGDRLVAVVATSPTAGVIFARAFRAGDIEALGALVETWHHDGLDTPLLLTADEFQRSLDTFPIEYQAMIDRHAVIVGTPPFDGATVSPDQLRRGCEVQAKGHLIHLRQGWLQAAGHEHRLRELIVSSAVPLRALLTNVARLSGEQRNQDDLALEGARIAGLPGPLMQALLELDDAPQHAAALVPQLPAYMAAAEALWAFIDSWTVDSTGRR